MSAAIASIQQVNSVRWLDRRQAGGAMHAPARLDTTCWSARARVPLWSSYVPWHRAPSIPSS